MPTYEALLFDSEGYHYPITVETIISPYKKPGIACLWIDPEGEHLEVALWEHDNGYLPDKEEVLDNLENYCWIVVTSLISELPETIEDDAVCAPLYRAYLDSLQD